MLDTMSTLIERSPSLLYLKQLDVSALVKGDY